MGIGSWGGGIVLGLVALLWLAYLIPSWHKRQEYLATERNAVRLQQTLRILAETSEVPEEIHIEANARSVASAQRILRSESAKREAIRRAQEAARQRAITRELAATAPVLRAAANQPALAARRLRRTRLVATLVLVASLVAFVFGVVNLASDWLLLAAGLVFGAGSVAVLTQLAAVSRARARRSQAAPESVVAEPVQAQALQDFAPRTTAVAHLEARDARAAVEAERTWTPVPVPRPLYLRRGSVRGLARSSAAPASPVSQADVDALRASAASSVDDLRRAQQEAALEAQHEALREVALAEAALDASRRRQESPVRIVSAAPAPVDIDLDVDVDVDRSPNKTPAAAPAASVDRAPRPESRFARMGFLDENETQEIQLDEILRRRRAV
ncbi:hypothetical protein [Frondihabitans cladoniiphilus]